MPSFDIVSEIDIVELRHAVDNATRELATRFDFRNVNALFELKDDVVKLASETDFQLNQMMDILRGNLAKHHIDARSASAQKPTHTGKTWSKNVIFQQGIETLVAKKLIKIIKDNKIKVQTSIQGEKVRITGKKRDDLQTAMALIRESDFEQPFQFNNFRD